ncbi:MAG TPA: MarR family transcriptional regulator [Nocardioides sp.]
MDAARARATEAMMPVSRTMTAIVARTLAEMERDITVPQLRVLVLLNSRGPMNLSALAEHLDVNPSNASRTCDQLVNEGLAVRRTDEADRRNVVLELTKQGSRLVADLMTQRRRLIDGVVSRMSVTDQKALARGLEAFSAAVEAAPPEESIGLPDGRLIPWLL